MTTGLDSVWDCPACNTRYLVRAGGYHVCVCGMRRLADGSVATPSKRQRRRALNNRRSLGESAISETGRVLRWGRAIARWIKAGRPVRNQEQIAELWAICSKCMRFDPHRQACSICECNISMSDNAMLNKLAMATEGCPIELWAPLVHPKRKCRRCGRKRCRKDRKLVNNTANG